MGDLELSKDQNRQELATKLEGILEPLKRELETHPEISATEVQLRIDHHNLNLLSKHFQNGNFSFWAGILERGVPDYSEIPHTPAAIIKNLSIPEKLRGRGVGPKIVGIWEESLSNQGIKIFLATNISNQRAIQFWRKLCYAIPIEQSRRKIPYLMYKIIRSPEI